MELPQLLISPRQVQSVTIWLTIKPILFTLLSDEMWSTWWLQQKCILLIWFFCFVIILLKTTRTSATWKYNSSKIYYCVKNSGACLWGIFVQKALKSFCFFSRLRYPFAVNARYIQSSTTWFGWLHLLFSGESRTGLKSGKNWQIESLACGERRFSHLGISTLCWVCSKFDSKTTVATLFGRYGVKSINLKQSVDWMCVRFWNFATPSDLPSIPRACQNFCLQLSSSQPNYCYNHDMIIIVI